MFLIDNKGLKEVDLDSQKEKTGKRKVIFNRKLQNNDNIKLTKNVCGNLWFAKFEPKNQLR